MPISVRFQTTTDTEIIVNLLARYGKDSLEEALVRSMVDLKGAMLDNHDGR